MRTEEYATLPASQAEAQYLAIDTQISPQFKRLPTTDDHVTAETLGNLAALHEEQATVHQAAMTVWSDPSERDPEHIQRTLRDANDKVRLLRLLERIWLARCTPGA